MDKMILYYALKGIEQGILETKQEINNLAIMFNKYQSWWKTEETKQLLKEKKLLLNELELIKQKILGMMEG